MLPWEKEIQQFWRDHELSLQKNYPGINFFRLKLLVQDLYWINFSSHTLSLDEVYNKLLSGTPLEYISREKYFYRAPFYVSESVLIPRSETEILVERASIFLKKHPSKNFVADVGTGSGAILLSLLMETELPLKTIATDISLKALGVARKNYERHRYQIHPNAYVDFYCLDRLTALNQKFDLIVSNPPYIKKQLDLFKVHTQTLKYEPHLALFLEDESYISWFQLFFQQIYVSLNEGGLALIEGHEDHLAFLQTLAKEIGFAKVNLIKDYNQMDRFLELYL